MRLNWLITSPLDISNAVCFNYGYTNKLQWVTLPCSYSSYYALTLGDFQARSGGNSQIDNSNEKTLTSFKLGYTSASSNSGITGAWWICIGY